MNDFDVVTGPAPDLAPLKLTPPRGEPPLANSERGSPPSLPSPSRGEGQGNVEGPGAD
jgi:hypothetical protein